MSQKPLTVAVTGMNATDNPGPGVAVIRSLKHNPNFSGRIVGLAYDSLDPGLYAEGLLDDAFLIPYPSQGLDALRERLDYIHHKVCLDVIIPTLDSELLAFMALEDHFQARNIGTFLPTREQFNLRSKQHLEEIGKLSGIKVPKTQMVLDASDLFSIHKELTFPIVIKGPFYGAEIVHSVDEAVASFHRTVATWGLPVIAQNYVDGEEVNVVAVGDGDGGLVGAVAMSKMVRTDKGKGWVGITISDPKLTEITNAFMAGISWRGPCELEVLRDKQGELFLLEINPRFPAWTYLSAGAGMNLPEAVMKLAAGETVAPMESYKTGKLFVRISLDQIADIQDFQQIASMGERTSINRKL